MPSRARNQRDPLKMSSRLPAFVAVATVVLTMVTRARGQFLQPQLNTNLARGRNVSVLEGNCSSSSCGLSPKQCYDLQVCTLTCLSGRLSTPKPVWPLIEGDRSSACPNFSRPAPPTPPSHVNASNYWYSNNSAPCQVNQTVSPQSSSLFFTLSFWLRGNCSFKCGPLIDLRKASLQSVFNLSLESTSLEISGNKLTSWPQVGNTWTHILIRKSSKSELFVNGILQTFPGFALPSEREMNLTLGFDKAYTGSPDAYIVDARFYPEALSNREVQELSSGVLNRSVPYPECFCPANMTELDSSGFLCVSNSDRVQKFGTVFHDPKVLVDGNASTAWVGSENITLELDLGGVYQLESLNVTFGGNSASSTLTLSAKYQDSWRNIASSFCTGQTCTGTVSTTLPSNRTALENTLGSAVRVTLRSSTYNLVIKELQLNGRCNCFGNTQNCSITGSGPVCVCENNTNTQGPQCGSCKGNFYRNSTEFRCRPCDCHPPGVNNMSNLCEAIGGACICKGNVEGTRCDQCKRLTYNLNTSTKDGCLNCSCDVNGTVSCDANTGACTCKSNVQQNNCSQCTDGHYGREHPDGCRPCNCDKNGTSSPFSSCNMSTGQCQCKTNVMGRQCDQCKSEYWNLDPLRSVGCQECNCHSIGRLSKACDATTGQCSCRGGVTPNRTCEPVITGMSPNFGPQYGGTKVIITGLLLGGKVPGLSVYVGGTKAKQVEMGDERVVFETPSGTSSGDENIRLDWINNTYQHPTALKFQYRPNPSVTPRAQAAAMLSYASGGCKLTVHGANLNSVAKPEVVATAVSDPSIRSTVQMCEFQSSSGSLQCRTPSLKGFPYNSTSLYNLSVDMDGTNFSLQAQVEVVEDPFVNVAESLIVEFPFSKSVTIRGKRLKQACSSEDLQVLVGEKECKVLRHTDTEIECEPPDLEGTSGKIISVTVFLGFSRHEAGTLEYRVFYKTPYFIYIIIGAAGLVLIVVVIIAISCLLRRRRRRRQKETNIALDDHTPAENNDYTEDPMGRDQSKGSTQHLSNNPLNTLTLTRPQSKTVDLLAFLNLLEHDVRIEVKTCLYIPSQFSPGHRCTKKGENFRVIDGEMTEKPIKLMIKTLVQPLPEGTSVPPWALAALRECLRFRGEQGEEGVLGMLGLGLDEHRFHILYATSHLQCLRDHIQDPRLEFTLAHLLEFSVQISEAMDYLSTKGVVHRDLATRNCYVTESKRVQVTDGAAGSDLYPNEYVFDSVRGRYLPLRWMAPECLRSGFYDTKSDVWSFGVVMWELFTRGQLPYSQVSDAEVERCVLDGFRLARPDPVSEPLYQFMIKCWEEDSSLRPSFLAVNRSLDPFLKGSSCNVEENFYMNQGEIK